MVRPKIKRQIESGPQVTYYKPQGIPLRDLEEVILTIEGFEALRLADAEGLDQATAAKQMNISPSTFCRVLKTGRATVAKALAEGLALKIEGGHYHFAASPRKPCCVPRKLKNDGPANEI